MVMKNKSSNHILRVAIIVALIINLFIAARSGWHIGVHTVYAIWGKPAEAVVQEVSRYFATVREPKPTRYSPRFRGQYVFDVRIDSVEPVRVTGRFDTSDFIGSSKNEMFTGDRLPIKYLSFYPYWSRPAMAFELVKLIIAGCFFAASSFLSAMFLLALSKMAYFLNPNQR
jgi:hypothetical protein